MTSGVNETAAAGFTAAAGEYERSRPSYPDDAVAHLRDALGIEPGRRVLDLACGTGKMTRLLSASGAALVGLDPVGSMLAQFRAVLPGVPVAAGVAERMPFADGSLDAIVAAQAWHWFDGDAAIAEAHRVLRPGRSLGLIWNVRDESEPWVAEMGRIFREYENKVSATVLRFWRGAWRESFERTTLFEPLERTDFRYAQRLDEDGVVERVLSVSFIATQPEPTRRAIAEHMRSVVAGRGEVELPYNVEVYTCRRIG